MAKLKKVKKKYTKKNLNSSSKPRCGICGKTTKLTKTLCCDQWICDDEDEYVLFSYARNSCYRNHDHFTLCGYHHAEEHSGNWKDCKKCQEAFETEMYVYYGTSEYNFEILENPPEYEPTKCSKCGNVISLSEHGYSIRGQDYFCVKCTNIDLENFKSIFKEFPGTQY